MTLPHPAPVAAEARTATAGCPAAVVAVVPVGALLGAVVSMAAAVLEEEVVAAAATMAETAAIAEACIPAVAEVAARPS